MLLGLVIHSAITYGVIDYSGGWQLKDPYTTHISNDYIVWFIHAFRMQIFFMIAGFFGALLFYDRSPHKMIRNRVFRIVLPFSIFIFLLAPTIDFSFNLSQLIYDDVPNAFQQALAGVSSWWAFLPSRTFHLWFLYYLTMITAVSIGLGFLFNKLKRLSAIIHLCFEWIIVRPVIRVVFFSLLTALLYLIMGTSSVATSTSWIPDFNTFLYYLSFYLVGWVLFKSKHRLDDIRKFDFINLILGVVLFWIYFNYYSAMNSDVILVVKSVMVWLLIFGITGLFIRYASKHSAIMRYVSDSSYWVYLIHLTLTAYLPGLIVSWGIPAPLKFLFVLVVSGLISFVSYHYLVRSTFIGELLNGRRYSRKLDDIRKADQLPQLKPVLDN